MKFFFVVVIMSYHWAQSTANSTNFTNVKIISNPIQTVTLKGTHTPGNCLFKVDFPVGGMDISDGVWQIKVGNVYIEDKTSPAHFDNVMLIFQIRTQLVTVLVNPMHTQVYTGESVKIDDSNTRLSNCRKPLYQLLRDQSTSSLYESIIPSGSKTEEILWAIAVTLRKSIPFHFFNPSDAGNEWFTVNQADKTGFFVYFEQKLNTALPKDTLFKFDFEVVFLFRRML